MDRHHSNAHNSIGKTNRRFKSNYQPTNYHLTATTNYQPSTTHSINFSVPASQNVITRPYLPGECKKSDKTSTSSFKTSYNTNLNKYKLLEKELDKRKKQQSNQKQQHQQKSKQPVHSQSYSNIFSNRSPQFANLDNCPLAKPTSLRSNATSSSTTTETTNSLNDLYKVENLFVSNLEQLNDDKKVDKSKSIEFIRTVDVIEKLNLSNEHNQKLEQTQLIDSKRKNSKSIDLKLNKEETKLNDKKIDEIKETSNQFNKHNLESNLLESKVISLKIKSTESSVDLDSIEKDSNLLDLCPDGNELETAKKECVKQNCWFSWFKVFLNCDQDHSRSFKDMTFVLIKKWYRELFLATFLLICILNAIRTSNLATRKSKLPEKFFPSNSLISDYEFGDISELSQLAFQNEVTFVMYYAPWDADCIAFKTEYLKISKHYKDQIFFAGVNCWWPDGECSKSYRIRKYPVFIAHIRNIGEVEYRGPLVASYLIPFLDNILNPVKPILNEGDLLDLKARHDAVVVGYFDFNENINPIGYKHFLLASIKALFQDPFRKVQFGIISSRKSAIKLYIDQSQSVNLYTWNSTYSYGNKLRKVDNFLKWIYNTLDEDGVLVEWISPIALKSDTLSVKLLSEPTLILFTPRSLILNISPYYDILREVAMDYFNCDNSPQIKSLIHRIILRRRLKEEKLFELEEKCHEIAQANANVEEYKRLNLPQDFSRDDICCHSQLLNYRPQGRFVDKKCYCTACVNINKKLCPKKFNCLATASRYLTSFEPNTFNNTINYCNEIKSTYHPKYTPYYDIKMSCSGIPNQDEDAETSDDYYKIKSTLSENEENTDNLNSFKLEKDTYQTGYVDESMQRMLKNFEEQHCKRLNLGLNYNDFNFPDSGEGSSSSTSQKWRQNFTGLGCRTNKTLGFIAIDSLMYQTFTESLGINAFNETHGTVIMIVEAQEENIYVLNHRLVKKENQISTINKKMIYEFIKDYSDSKLRRYLKSPLENEISSSENCLNKTDEAGRRIICVPEITTLTFNEIVLDDSKDVLLLFYTPWCVFCSAIASTFLTVAKFFIGIDNILFARLNADVNDLPFEYSVDRYPSLILFPAKRKSESVTFPLNMPITTTSLLQFVLANVQDKVKWESSFQLCNRECLKRNFLAHHVESKELNLEKIRLINRINNLKKELRPLLNNAKNKNLKKVLNDYLSIYQKMIRSKENRLNLFNNLKEILSKRILNFDDETIQDLNNQLINDMVNLLNSPKPTQQQTTDKIAVKNQKSTKSSKLSKKIKSKVTTKKDEL